MTARRMGIAAAVLFVIGAVFVIVFDAVVISAIGWGLMGIAGVLLVSLVFLLIGESEDRDRMRNPHG